jgi:hypothetical protein
MVSFSDNIVGVSIMVSEKVLEFKFVQVCSKRMNRDFNEIEKNVLANALLLVFTDTFDIRLIVERALFSSETHVIFFFEKNSKFSALSYIGNFPNVRRS